MSNLQQLQKKIQIRKQHYKSLPPLHVAFVTNITLLHVSAGFPVPLLDYAWIISFKVGRLTGGEGKGVLY
jgi:hypothetical protein